MLYVFGFVRAGVVLSDLYFVDPDPSPGQEGAEHGVRLEVRLLERREHPGSVYAARPILVDEPIWRVDLLESVDGTPGSFDRTHHHPLMRGWEPGRRRFERALSDDPFGFLAARLGDLPALLAQAGKPVDCVDPDDARQMRQCAQEIVDAARRLLERVRAGELAVAPTGQSSGLARTGWL